MPNRDGTGPNGKGSQNGRKLGKCNSNTNITQNEQKKHIQRSSRRFRQN